MLKKYSAVFTKIKEKIISLLIYVLSIFAFIWIGSYGIVLCFNLKRLSSSLEIYISETFPCLLVCNLASLSLEISIQFFCLLFLFSSFWCFSVYTYVANVLISRFNESFFALFYEVLESLVHFPFLQISLCHPYLEGKQGVENLWNYIERLITLYT